MTTSAAQAIRNRDGINANPIESNILYYTLRILHLHFVFDGPKRLSNGGKLYPGHGPPSLLFRETLTHIGSFTRFRVYKLDNIEGQHHGMGREGFILYALFNGRPNDVEELSNLGPQDVFDAAERGLGKSLCAACNSGENLWEWVSEFDGYLKDVGSKIQIPPQFPRRQHVQDYVNPDVSTLEALLDFTKRETLIDERKLFSFLVNKFQWTVRKWVKFVVPVRIVRSLLATKDGQECQHNHLKLECVLKTQDTKNPTARFLLCEATSVDISALNEKKGKLQTLWWILRKANLNLQQSLGAYFTPPNSENKGKSISSASASGDAFQRSEHKGGREPLATIWNTIELEWKA
ncbi:uncharacterized protein PAC_18125 [Phialocephala subalpina]|uniref:Uncharacterized protein n=1 Tax=Phialocephala subalpina TaxID=576137 RepID=A0A1L7XT58_9HELO|nr:uncharacterized protein PAC_18125 [Phialocephala subalpina]